VNVGALGYALLQSFELWVWQMVRRHNLSHVKIN